MSVKPKLSREDVFDLLARENVPIANALPLLRKSVGKNQVDYAGLTGVSLRVLRAIEQGKGNPTVETMEKLLQPFNLQLVVKPSENFLSDSGK